MNIGEFSPMVRKKLMKDYYKEYMNNYSLTPNRIQMTGGAVKANRKHNGYIQSLEELGQNKYIKPGGKADYPQMNMLELQFLDKNGRFNTGRKPTTIRGDGIIEDAYNWTKNRFLPAMKPVASAALDAAVIPVSGLTGIHPTIVGSFREGFRSMTGIGVKKGRGVKSAGNCGCGGCGGSGGSKKGSSKKGNRIEIVRKVMRDKGMSMIEASKYVKANNLY